LPNSGVQIYEIYWQFPNLKCNFWDFDCKLLETKADKIFMYTFLLYLSGLGV